MQELLKFLLWPFALIYGLINTVRNYCYDKKLFKSTGFHHPLISIGNLTVGGTGKTPHIEYLVRMLQHRFSMATLSRGYGRKTAGFLEVNINNNAEEVGDEPLQFRRKFPLLRVFVGENRLMAIPEILQRYPENQCILLDDAFQHRAVKPGLSILLTEYHKPYTRDWLLPAGSLREPARGYHRADIIIVTKCPEQMPLSECAAWEKELRPMSYQHLYYSTFSYGAIYHMTDAGKSLSLEKDMDVLVLSAIADPAMMISYLEPQVRNVFVRRFRDHHYFDRFDLESVKESFQNMENPKKALITTEKDATRLALHLPWILAQGIDIYILPVAVKFLHQQESKFEQDIIQYLEFTLHAK
jgi:tetraacyldisaccharide 4'-kinase